MPLYWNHRQTFAPRGVVSIPPPAYHHHDRSRGSFSGMSGLWTSSSSSNRSMFGPPRSRLRPWIPRLRPWIPSRDQSQESHVSSSASHTSQLPRDYDDRLCVLRPDDTRMVTTIQHDPVGAAEAARRVRSSDDEEEGKERAKAAIQQTTEVQVQFEEAGPEENSCVRGKGKGESI
ncbi:hypothetical protein AC578_9381 [Pseudocercospora eumusae]|uniref:Uncharacterized protein n=1 Tax=Pseudocercospora eumusae TaxID=321146 RepID=A0A139H1J2_9PEZI|nr:hypothetical protein AC578_9381 [Pseudocercospora eumusae]